MGSQRILALFFIGSKVNGQTHYAVTHRLGWFERCTEAGRHRKIVKFGASNVHLSLESHLPAEDVLTAKEQTQLRVLEDILAAHNGGSEFSIDCFANVLCFQTAKELTVEVAGRVFDALGLYLFNSVNMTVEPVDIALIEQLQLTAGISEKSARWVLESLKQ